MFAILGEDDSDVATLAEMIRRLRGDPGTPIKGKGYSGAGEWAAAHPRAGGRGRHLKVGPPPGRRKLPRRADWVEYWFNNRLFLG